MHQIKAIIRPCKFFSALLSVVLNFSLFAWAQSKDIKEVGASTGVTKEYKLAPFTTLYLKGPLCIQVDAHISEPRLEIKGEKEIVKKTKIWILQPEPHTLHLTAPASFHNANQLSITLYAPALKEIYHQSSKPVRIFHLRAPVSIMASGMGDLSIEDIRSRSVYLQGSEKSRIRLSGRIDTLEASLQDYATLDTTHSYVQRSFVKTQDHAFVMVGVNEFSFAATALGHSLIRYTYDAPVQGLLAHYKAWIVRTPNNISG